MMKMNVCLLKGSLTTETIDLFIENHASPFRHFPYVVISTDTRCYLSPSFPFVLHLLKQ